MELLLIGGRRDGDRINLPGNHYRHGDVVKIPDRVPIGSMKAEVPCEEYEVTELVEVNGLRRHVAVLRDSGIFVMARLIEGYHPTC